MTALTSPPQLWHRLQTDAGLEIRRKSGVPGRDADVEISLKEALGLSAHPGPLADWLDLDAAAPVPTMSIERFLVALLTSQRAYAFMMRDLLEMLADAGARRDSGTLDLKFRFDAVSDPVRYTLEEFREVVERVENVLVSRFELPSARQLWDLLPGLRQVGVKTSLASVPAGFPAVPAAPVSGHAALDKVLCDVTGLASEFRALCSKFGATRWAAFQAAPEPGVAPDGEGQRKIAGLLGAASNYWDVQALEAVQQIAAQAANGSLDAGGTAAALGPLLAGIEQRQDWVKRTYDDLLDSLQLPSWKKRHELFSVWTGRVLLCTAREHAESFHYHVVDGCLSFAFGGSRLATYVYNGEQFDIWAELRSALVGTSSKRKKGIQPDFRILRPALATSHNAATHLVLECKHYLAPSVANFSAAARDYATSCPAASVLVVNHGPINPAALTAAVTSDLNSRIRFMGGVSAENERQSAQLGNALQRTLFPLPATSRPAPASALPLKSGSLATIVLRWDETLLDMDLLLDIEHADGRVERIDFNEQGDLAQPPFARLEKDVRQGPGEERIDISLWYGQRYRIMARNFSNTGELGPRNLACVINLGITSSELQCPALGDGTEWKIGELIVENGKATLQDLT
jgi:hypothetical protein